MFFILL